MPNSNQLGFDIEDATQYLVMAGSHSYGTQTNESDIDVRGWAIPPKDFFLSHYKRFNQTDEGWSLKHFPWNNRVATRLGMSYHGLIQRKDELVDCTIYNLQKFVKLAVKCNPNIIELLFVDDEDILYMSELGATLRMNRNLFLTARAYHTFTGYAVSQLKRLNNRRQDLLSLGVSKNRNLARAKLEVEHGYDTKHASHLFRLLWQAQEILKKGTLTVKDKHRANLLRQIRTGSLKYDQLIKMVDNEIKNCDFLYRRIKSGNLKTILYKPDKDRIDELMVDIIREDFGEVGLSRCDYRDACELANSLGKWED